MTTSLAPSPAAYVATIRPLPLHHPSLRRVRLSARHVDALTGMPVPIVIDGTSKATPCTQGELAIQDAVSDTLGDREVCAVLYRWSDGGELWVMCGGSFVQVANIELAPARTAVAA
jgi:hypothetical protein